MHCENAIILEVSELGLSGHPPVYPCFHVLRVCFMCFYIILIPSFSSFSSIHPLSHLAFLITVCVIITTVWRQFPTSPGMVLHFSGNIYLCFKTYSVLCTVIVRFSFVSLISPFSPFPLDMNYHSCIFVVCGLFFFFLIVHWSWPEPHKILSGLTTTMVFHFEVLRSCSKSFYCFYCDCEQFVKCLILSSNGNGWINKYFFFSLMVWALCIQTIFHQYFCGFQKHVRYRLVHG